MTDDDLTAALAKAQKIADGLAFACRLPDKKPDFFACGGPAAEAYWDYFTPARISSLLAAVEVALKDHRKSLFPAGPPGAGSAYGKHYCAGICYTSIDDQVIYRVWPCQPYQAITSALTGKEEP